jgi:hypothetical protein
LRSEANSRVAAAEAQVEHIGRAVRTATEAVAVYKRGVASRWIARSRISK